MEKNNTYYMRLHTETLYTMNEGKDLLTIREPWDMVSQQAPRLYLIRPLYEKPYAYFRSDIPKELREQLRSMVGKEPELVQANEPPVFQKEYLKLFKNGEISQDACFWVPRQSGSNVCILTADTLGKQGERYFPWLSEELGDVPFCAACMAENQIVSVCRSVRILPEAEEAGIETEEGYRRNGFALATLAAWAETVRKNGSIPLYSADTSNTASLHLAQKAGCCFFGNGFSIW